MSVAAIKSILLPRDDVEISTHVLATALEIARRFKAHLEVLQLRRSPEHAVPYLLGSLSRSTLRETIMDAAEREEDERTAMVRQNFDEFCGRHGIAVVDGPSQANGSWTASWRAGERQTLVHRARLNDLSVVARPPDTSRPATLETLLLESGRPVMMVPPVVGETLATRVAIGWNDSTEAASAVVAAMPFLSGADSVTILASAKRSESARELSEYLAWHRVAAAVRPFEPAGRSVAVTLLNEAKIIGADLFVAGGYSHTRAREILFGGVTQHLIADADLPVLLAH